LLLFISVTQLTNGSFLYQKGDKASNFYFLLSGSIELIVKSDSDQDFKFSRSVDKATFFGLKKNCNEERGDYARVTSDQAELIVIDASKYN
jgi:CRP-like cAMP-binding protein